MAVEGGQATLSRLLADKARDQFIAASIRRGEFEWLRRTLEEGNPLGPETTKTLLALLYGEIKKPRGNKRTFREKAADAKWLEQVQVCMTEKGITENAAMLELAADETVKFDTLRSAIKRAKLDVSQWSNKSASDVVRAMIQSADEKKTVRPSGISLGT